MAEKPLGLYWIGFFTRTNTGRMQTVYGLGASVRRTLITYLKRVAKYSRNSELITINNITSGTLKAVQSCFLDRYGTCRMPIVTLATSTAVFTLKS